MDGKFIFKWGVHGIGDYQFFHPTGMCIRPIYSNQSTIKCSNNSESKINRLVKSGSIPICFAGSRFSPVYSDEAKEDCNTRSEAREDCNTRSRGEVIYISDEMNHRILCYYLDGSSNVKLVGQWKLSNELRYPSNVMVEYDKVRESNIVYVADTSNNCVKKFESTDLNTIKYVEKWGDVDDDSHPNGIARGIDGALYIAESEKNRIVMVDM